MSAQPNGEQEENGFGQEKMEDGGNPPLPASGREKVAKKDYDTETGILSVIFKTGEKRDVELGKLPESIVTQLAMHGLSQKLGDSYASVKGDVAKAIVLFDGVLKQLQEGEWAKARGDGDSGGSRVTELAEAIARFQNVPVEKAQQVIGQASDENVKAWKQSPKLKAIIAQIRAEKAAKRAQEAEKEANQVPAEDPADSIRISM